MIAKIKWNKFIKNNFTDYLTSLSQIKTLIQSVNTLYNTKYGVQNIMYSSFVDFIDPLNVDNTDWRDMYLYLSTYKTSDKRGIEYALSYCLNYLTFYKSILQSEGIKGTEKTHLEGTDDLTLGTSTNTFDSEVPQVPNIDESVIDAMNYLSSASKSVNSGTDNRELETDTETTRATWEEELKNKNMLFKDNLQLVLNNIPKMIYNYYSLDAIPVGEALDMFKDSFRKVEEL